MAKRVRVVAILSAERLRRKADEIIFEAEIANSSNARERLRDAAARLLEAAGYVEGEAALG